MIYELILILISILAFNPEGFTNFLSNNLSWILIAFVISTMRPPNVSEDSKGRKKINNLFASSNQVIKAKSVNYLFKFKYTTV